MEVEKFLARRILIVCCPVSLDVSVCVCMAFVFCLLFVLGGLGWGGASENNMFNKVLLRIRFDHGTLGYELTMERDASCRMKCPFLNMLISGVPPNPTWTPHIFKCHQIDFEYLLNAT